MMTNSTIEVTDAQGVTTSLRALAYPAVKASSVDADAADSDVLRRTFVVPMIGVEGWNDANPPKVGINVSSDGKSYKVTAVSPFLGTAWELETREC